MGVTGRWGAWTGRTACVGSRGRRRTQLCHDRPSSQSIRASLPRSSARRCVSRPMWMSSKNAVAHGALLAARALTVLHHCSRLLQNRYVLCFADSLGTPGGSHRPRRSSPVNFAAEARHAVYLQPVRSIKAGSQCSADRSVCNSTCFGDLLNFCRNLAGRCVCE